ncbi:interferon alpha/beta receptor 1 [Emydura macquarii macquarii]|uniref:interferon alpha/beta receptor 1 n=1 Tax=Emydura macquarii macquarii TaxID=1129001 RepID=UPI00352AB69C
MVLPKLGLLLPFLLAVAPLGHAGQMNLMSPQNVQVHAVNTNFTLRWNWDSQKDFNVTFSAQYQRILEDYEGKEEEIDWKEISGCQNVSVTECDFSSSLSSYIDSYNVHVRAEKGEEKSPWSITLSFRPYSIAKIGPPGVQLESIDGVVKINIFPPEENQNRKMWTNDISFTYHAVFWENSSNSEPKSKTINRRDIIYDLAPDTVYCLRVQAHITSERKVGSFSPVYCVKTTEKAWNALPYPMNVEVHALNMKFLLAWDNQNDQNVSFTVQYLSAYLKSLQEDHSDKWITVSGCENITTTQCDFSSAIVPSGIYFLRVQAINGYNKSRWSNEIKVDPCVVNEIGPPSVTVSPNEDSLRIQLTAPGESENKSMSEFYDLSYRILYWKNSSDVEKKIKDLEQLLFTIPDLEPFTLYCLKVQAFSPSYKKNGRFSEVECIKTLNGKTSPLTILFTFIIALTAFFFSASFIIFGIYYISRRIKYAFFPSCKPPSNIECLGGQSFNSPYLSTSEEPTETCCIIESIVIEETNQTDFKDYKHSKQSSRDSGNYSNDDDTSGTKVSEETLEQETA